MDRTPASTSLEVREGEVQVILPVDKIAWGLERNVFGLGAQVRGSAGQPWSPLMKRPEFIDISPTIHFDPSSSDPVGVDGILCTGPDRRIIMDLIRLYRRSPDFSKVGFVFPAVLPDSPTLFQRVRMSRLHRSLYSFYICDGLLAPQTDFFMYLCVVNLRQGDDDGGTSTAFRLEGAEVPQESRELLRFDLPQGHLDVRKIRLIAPKQTGKRLLTINCESRKMAFAKGAAIFGAAFLTEAAIGHLAGVGVHVVGALLAEPMRVVARVEVMDQTKARLVSDRRAQILSAVSSSLDANGLKGIRNRYGDVVTREEILKSFERYVSTQRLDNITEKDWKEHQDRGKKLFGSFAQLEYGVQVSV